jgi:hypothetical protein
LVDRFSGISLYSFLDFFYEWCNHSRVNEKFSNFDYMPAVVVLIG